MSIIPCYHSLTAKSKSCNEDSSKIFGGLCKESIIEGGALYWIHDFIANFGVNNWQLTWHCVAS